jgi:hypothetical protein
VPVCGVFKADNEAAVGVRRMKVLKKLICALAGHRYVVQRVFSPTSRKVGCTRCGKTWGMSDNTHTLLPWDDEMEQTYRDFK